jgi:hypothetical protein
VDFGRGSSVNFLSESFDISRVSGVELIESFLGDSFKGGEAEERASWMNHCE